MISADTVRMAAKRQVLRPVQWALNGATKRHSDVVVFIVPGGQEISGGIISIHDLARQSQRVGDSLGFDCRVATLPGSVPTLRHHAVPDSCPVYDFRQILNYYADPKRMVVHVPEFFVRLAKGETLLLRHLKNTSNHVDVTLNVLIQNIHKIADDERWNQFRQRCEGLALTATTAHTAYCTPRMRERLGVPLHHFSTWISGWQYAPYRYQQKTDCMVLSPDNSLWRADFLSSLKLSNASVTLRVIENLTYAQYLEIVRTSKWSVTFGEGLDAYFIELALSGGVPFAVFNDDFFTPEFLDLPNVFKDREEFSSTFSGVFDDLTDPAYFRATSQATRDIIDSYYRYDDYVDNIARYYAGFFDYP